MANLEEQFQEILDALRVFAGFALLPVEVPTRVEGEALVAFFQKTGKRITFLNSHEEPGYAGIAGKLVALQHDSTDLVIVLGGAKNNAGLKRELGAVNWGRDLLVRDLARPILWCGPPSFLNETWGNAPDFWSVRESGFVIKSPINPTPEPEAPPVWQPQIRIPLIKIPRDIRPAARFVGRKEELKQLEKALEAKTGPIAITAVHGMPGVGKSFLAEHFAHLHQDRFPDGIFRISLNPDETRTVELLEETLAMKLGLKTRQGLDDVLAQRRVLLLVENVDSEVHVALTTRFLEPRRHLLSVIVTGRVTGIGRRLGWRQIPLGAMDKSTALELFREWGISARSRDERELLERLAEELAYLPLGLALAAGYIEAGGRAQGFLDEMRRSKLQWAAPDAAAISDDGERARQVLASSFAISRKLAEREVGAAGCAALALMGALLRQEFGADLGAAVSGLEAGAFERLVQVATHLSLLETAQVSPIAPRFRFHPLMAAYLESITSVEDQKIGWQRLTGFFESRMLLPDNVTIEERRKRQDEIVAEWATLTDWLEKLPDKKKSKISFAT